VPALAFLVCSPDSRLLIAPTSTGAWRDSLPCLGNFKMPVLFYLFLLLPQHAAGRATIYWPGDGHCGSMRADGKMFTRADNHIAHRWLPLGTAGWLCSRRTGRCTLTSVQDRGPFGSCPAAEAHRLWPRCRGWRVHTRPRRGWRYRGEFDITRPVAEAIQHRPFDVVDFFYWREPLSTS
jgi:hypothetical protein